MPELYVGGEQEQAPARLRLGRLILIGLAVFLVLKLVRR